MEQKELIELYVEELALLQRIQGFYALHWQENPSRFEIVLLLGLYRFFADVHSA